MAAVVEFRATGDVAADPRFDRALLSPAEVERAAKFRRPQDREDFVAAHALVRLLAADVLGVAPAELTVVQRCATCGGPHGKPTLAGHPDVNVSLAHTRGVVAAAVGDRPVGVDVERTDRAPDLGDFRHVFTAAEVAQVRAAADPDLAVLRQWVRKESLIKIGAGSLDTLTTLDLSGLPVDEPAAGLRFGELYLLDWLDPVLAAVGAAVGETEVVSRA